MRDLYPRLPEPPRIEDGFLMPADQPVPDIEVERKIPDQMPA